MDCTVLASYQGIIRGNIVNINYIHIGGIKQEEICFVLNIYDIDDEHSTEYAIGDSS